MTIGIDCRLYSPKYTGIGRYVFELIKNLMNLDQTNHYILYFNSEEYDDFVCPNERWEKRLVTIPHYSLAEQTKFLKVLNREQIDLMYFPHFNAPIRYKKPFVVTIHDLTLHHYPNKSYHPRWSAKKSLQIAVYRFIMGRVLKHARKIIAVSDNTRQDLIREYLIPEEKIVKILEGVPESFQQASEEQLDRVRNTYAITKPYLLYTGVWRSHKNLLNLIQAFHQLLKRGHDIQLVLTGKKDPSYPEIPKLIEDLDLKNEVILTGFVSEEDLIALNSGARVFVFPSLYEGFGLPPLEAMQLGVPVACSKNSSLPEVCGDAALYFDPHQKDDMVRQIELLLIDEALRDEMIRRGHENLKRFSWKTMSSGILDIFNSFRNNTNLKKI
ncbi:MAG: glycosyltransferase family 1 protein [bacterium]|nr:glycosyltransferase family 1 protein [bacterium]